MPNWIMIIRKVMRVSNRSRIVHLPTLKKFAAVNLGRFFSRKFVNFFSFKSSKNWAVLRQHRRSYPSVTTAPASFTTESHARIKTMVPL